MCLFLPLPFCCLPSLLTLNRAAAWDLPAQPSLVEPLPPRFPAHAMKATTIPVLLGALSAMSHAAPVVDTMYPYTGPAIPVGDWVDPTVNGNGKGYPRLMEPPAVKPASANPTNNINVISLAYLPTGMNIHFQTPFGLGKNEAPSVRWGTSPEALDEMAAGLSRTCVFDSFIIYFFVQVNAWY